MNRQFFVTVLAAAGVAWGSVMAQGAELAVWNTDKTSPGAAEFATTTVAEGVSAAALTRGAGLTTGTAGGTFAASGYDTSSKSYDSAVKAGDYWETTLTPNGGLLALESLSYSFGGSKAGPSTWQWAAKVGASGSWTALGSPVTFERSSTTYQTYTLDLTEIDVTDQAVSFRLVAWGATDKQGTGSFGKDTDVLAFYGTVQSADGPPVVRFTPASGTVAVSNTFTMTVGVMPAGSGISKWSLSPTPQGAATLAGGTFTFSPVGTDVRTRFALSVTATNAHGSTTAETTVFVDEWAPEGTLTLTFDNERQTSWSGAASVTIPSGSGLTWKMENCMIGEDAENDKVYGGTGKALRFAYDEPGTFQSLAPIVAVSGSKDERQTNGVDRISFWYGIYGEDTGEESEHTMRPTLVTELSDDAKLWVEVDRVSTEGSESALQKREIEVGVETPVYFRIRVEGVAGSSRVNVDQVRVVPKVTEKNPRTLFMLQYNVTPGDEQSTCERNSADDWDGDGLSNFEEYNHRPNRTNPYDKNDP